MIVSNPESTAPPTSLTIDLDSVPTVLRDDVERILQQQRSGISWGWLLLALCAALILLAQIAWMNREWVFVHYPPMKVHAESLCNRLNCRVESSSHAAHVELVARDVREHPQYTDTLLVNATLTNRAEGVAAFPIIQLGIYDRSGGVVGIRRFQPTDYLDQSIDIDAGMSPGRIVYVVLEIAEPSDRADSFEFIFL
jgi:Protein of unknown function (DUF3426)